MQQQTSLTPQQIAELQRHVGYGATWLGPVLVAGQGSRVTDIDGKSYIDCTAQAWTLALGYNHPEVMEAALAQMRTLPHVRAGFPTLPRLQLAKRLADLCPGRLNIVTYAPTGSLGIESAMKLAMINRPGGAPVRDLLPRLPRQHAGDDGGVVEPDDARRATTGRA